MLAGHRNDYHSLLGLHHSMQLRRSMRGEDRAEAADPGAKALACWPERLADQRSLRQSLSLLQPLDETLDHLYVALFRDGPHLKPLFPGSLMTQRRLLAQSVEGMIQNLDKPEVLLPTLIQLGQAHRRLGVRAAHFDRFGAAFMEALQFRAGVAWRPDYDQAWLRAYRFVTQVMTDASRGVVAEPPYVRGTVVAHQKYGPDLAVIRVRATEPYPYRPGQYATLESPLLPRAWRSYSMATPQSDERILEFHVRATGVGNVSDMLVHRTFVGDGLRIGPARGTMTLDQPSAYGILLAAGGTGLAAIQALLADVARLDRPPATWLFFGSRSRESRPDLRALVAYAQRTPWLHLITTVELDPAYPDESGTLVDAVLRRGDWSGCDAYLSGPAGMITSLESELVRLGVEPSRIKYDQQPSTW